MTVDDAGVELHESSSSSSTVFVVSPSVFLRTRYRYFEIVLLALYLPTIDHQPIEYRHLRLVCESSATRSPDDVSSEDLPCLCVVGRTVAAAAAAAANSSLRQAGRQLFVESSSTQLRIGFASLR